MSADAVAQASGVGSPSGAIENVSAEADKHTPETPPLNDPPAAPQPANVDSGGLAELRAMVEQLASTVDTLVGTVTAAAPDTKTVRVPWPARGGRR